MDGIIDGLLKAMGLFNFVLIIGLMMIYYLMDKRATRAAKELDGKLDLLIRASVQYFSNNHHNTTAPEAAARPVKTSGRDGNGRFRRKKSEDKAAAEAKAAEAAREADAKAKLDKIANLEKEIAALKAK